MDVSSRFDPRPGYRKLVTKLATSKFIILTGQIGTVLRNRDSVSSLDPNELDFMKGRLVQF